jgi:hypothetical protein
LSTNNLAYYLNAILTKGRKDNTYKFALTRFLIDHSYTLDDEYIQQKLKVAAYWKVEFSIIAKSFLKYYWHQICKYRIRQKYNPDKPPLIVQIIQNEFGENYIPEPFEKMNLEKIFRVEKMMTKKCFLGFKRNSLNKYQLIWKNTLIDAFTLITSYLPKTSPPM